MVPSLQNVRKETGKGRSPREIALRVLLAGGGQTALDAALRENELFARDRALLTQLVYGPLKMQRSLDWSLSRVVKRPLATLTPALHWTLRLGAYQLLFLDKIPAHSAVDESVKLARRLGHAGTASLANAVLRKIALRRETPPLPTPDEPVDAFADFASLPNWIAQHFIDRFGFADAVRATQGMNGMPRRAARVNTRMASVDETSDALRRVGIVVQASRYGIAECLVLASIPASGASALQRMIGSGRLTMQSEESQLAEQLLDPQPGEIILDVCAGRGVKTGALAQRCGSGPVAGDYQVAQGSSGKIVALDDDATKLALLQQDMVRLGVENVEVVRADATRKYEVGYPQGFDAILVDAPCSGIGTIGRRADLRWAKDPSDPARLARTQAAILAQAASHAKPGGRMLYVTCSTDAREDEDVVKEFLGTHRTWQAVPLPLNAPEGTFIRIQESILTIPGIDGADGFFYAMLRKR